MDVVDDGEAKYDRVCLLTVTTDGGAVGDIVQDVVTFPAEKSARVQGTQGFISWHVDYRQGYDAVFYGRYGEKIEEVLIPKSRPEDCRGEINHIEAIFRGEVDDSPIALEHGIETMLIVAAANVAHQHGKAVRIDRTAGCGRDALRPISG